MVYKVYQFEVESLAQAAIEEINLALGYPKNAEAVTRSYTEYRVINGGIYILWDEVIEPILGPPIEIEVQSLSTE